MKTPCIQPEELPRVLTLPAHDPQRRHLESCLHCRAMGLAYEEFMDPDGVRPGFDLEAADAVLTERLAAIIGETRTEPVRSRRPARLGGARTWYAAAAVLLVCAGIFVARDAVLLTESRLPDGVGAARGETKDATELAWVEADDGWRLTWREAVAGSPVLVFFDAELEELARRPLAGAGSVREETRSLRQEAMATPERAVYLQLIFEQEGDVVARSAVISARPGQP